ncbi:MAG TPA: arylsulfatase [Acidobacteriota bacterium]|nr:arylsulfatase [Acidobacteriota bacterium]
MRHKILVLLALVVFGHCSFSANQSNPSAERPPNIILILADDLGYGDVGFLGQETIQTPNIDRFAGEGMRFTNFYAGSTVCAPSRSVLMTGQHTGHTLIRGNAKTNLRPEDVTVAEILKEAGYATALIGKWGLGHEGSTGVPTRQGFDFFFGYLDQTHAHNYFPTFLLRNEERLLLDNIVPSEGKFGQGQASEKKVYSPDLMIEEALKFIDENKDRPFFLYFATTLPHANNEAGVQGMEIPDYGIYSTRNWPEPQKGLAAMISRLDKDIGRIMDAVQKAGIDENTFLFFSSDNGPHAEGGNDPDFFNSNGPFQGIKRALYEGGIRVPTFVRWPGQVKGGSETSHVAYLGDFMATAAELAGIKVPAEAVDSISFLPVALGEEQRQQTHSYLYWEFYERGSAQAVRMGNWKAVRTPMLTGEIELYNLSLDIGETTNLAEQHPDIVEQIRQIMEDAHEPSPLWKVPDQTGS